MFVIVLSVFLFFIAVKWPEVGLALFLCAGSFKADPRFSALTQLIDPTILIYTATLLGIFTQAFRRQIFIKLPDRKILFPYFVFVTIMITSLLYTDSPNYGLEKTMRFCLLTSFALFAPCTIFSRREAFSRFFICFICYSLLFSTLTMSANYGSSDRLLYESGFEGANYLAVGRISGMGALIIFFYYIIDKKNKLFSLLALLALLTLISSMLISGGKGPLIGMAISIVVVTLCVILFKKKNAVSKTIVLRIYFANLLVVVSMCSLYFFFSDYVERTLFRFQVLLSAGGGDSALARQQMIKSTLSALQDLPTLLGGLGVGGFSMHFANFDSQVYPHNIFLETIVEMGIFALIAVAVLIIVSAAKVMTLLKYDIRLASTLGALLIFTLFNALVSGDLNDNKQLFFCLGAIFSQHQIRLCGPSSG